MRQGASLPGIANYNEKVVLHAIRTSGGISQAELVDRTGLATQTVSAIVNQLLAKGQVRASGVQSVGRGRPRTILELVPDSRFALGFHIDPSLVTVVVLNLAGQVVRLGHSREVLGDDPAASVPAIADLARALIRDSGIDASRLVGSCVATPGVVDAAFGGMVHPLWMPTWDRYPIRDRLADLLGMPVDFVKDTLAAVTGETWLRASADDCSLVFLYLGIGVGVGVAINGEVLGGASGNGGEIGRLLVAVGRSDTQDAYAGRGMDNDPAILAQRAIESAVMPGDPGATSTLPGIDAAFRQLCRLARDGNVPARDLLAGAGARLATAIVAVAEIVDADEVVYGGPYWELVREFYEPAAAQAIRTLSGHGPHSVRLSGTSMGQDVGAIGAAARVLDGHYVPRTRLMR
ncbi:MAG: ROK family transcriptional regulator [Propionicimonas sp.]|uniref:ROK family transcriptional regulator n=1 Tax=Propionicimonas sp. TaxID=1955623 RepID=UPI002B1EC543|nr:ROK family transcriptional regulator [Propionicimonas sp.]MEA4945578.1 ROK family transcriptional regulator [Propionicimonas sp.]MEA5119035.1 ROK family transcriptional regulator [Propionicimonas sp.]